MIARGVPTLPFRIDPYTNLVRRARNVLSALSTFLLSAITVVHDVPPSSADLGRRKDLSPSPFSSFFTLLQGERVLPAQGGEGEDYRFPL